MKKSGAMGTVKTGVVNGQTAPKRKSNAHSGKSAGKGGK